MLFTLAISIIGDVGHSCFLGCKVTVVNNKQQTLNVDLTHCHMIRADDTNAPEELCAVVVS